MNHVIVYEDDPDIAQLIGIILHSMNCTYEIQDAFSSNVTEIENKHPQALVVDYWLSNGTAEDFIPKIRKNAALSSTPILLISAISNLPTIAEQLHVSYIAKPFDILHFQEAMSNILHLKN